MSVKKLGFVLYALMVFVVATYIFVRMEQNGQSLLGFENAELKRLQVVHPPADAPKTAFMARDGSPKYFSDFAGEVVLVNFWATWCAPCREEMPSLARLSAMMKDRPFRLITITLDREGFAVADPFLEEVGALSLETYEDKSNRLLLEAAEGSVGLPLTLLLNKDGKVIARMLGPAEWDGEAAISLIERALEN